MVQLISRRSQPRKTRLRVIDSIIFLLASGDITVSIFATPFVAPDETSHCVYRINVRLHPFMLGTAVFAGHGFGADYRDTNFDKIDIGLLGQRN